MEAPDDIPDGDWRLRIEAREGIDRDDWIRQAILLMFTKWKIVKPDDEWWTWDGEEDLLMESKENGGRMMLSEILNIILEGTKIDVQFVKISVDMENFEYQINLIVGDLILEAE